MSHTDLRSRAVPFLLWLAFRGTASRDEIERRWSGDSTIPALLEDLIGAELIGEDDGCVFMDDGGDELLSEGCRGALSESEQVDFESFVAEFDPIDADLKAAVTLWQRSRGGPEELDKEALDVIADWLGIHDRLKQAVASAGGAVGKVLRMYLEQLDEAVERFMAGDHDAFTGGDESSYHSVWFVMHELILRTVGRSR
jgi:hypothetical protein